MKTRRHEEIKSLITKFDIETQEELLKKLFDAGYDVTQATVSRDIKELRLAKTLSSKGKYRYSTGQENSKDISTKMYSLFADSVLSVDFAQNLIVIKCVTGMAQAVCASMDANMISAFMGTLAGDDTIFIVCKTSEIAAEKTEELKELIVN